jgi:putative ABC transport system permease protein
MNRPFWKPPVNEEVEGELDFHIEMRTREYIARGLDPQTARQRALALFGDVAEVKSICRSIGTQRENDMKRAALWSEFLRDLRQSRGLLRTPAYTFLLILTLALGMGANTALFSVVKSVLLTPLPYTDPDRVVMLWSRWVDFPERTWVGLEEFQNYQNVIKRVTGLALISGFETSITEGDDPERVSAYSVTPNLFNTLGVSAVAGRTFTADDAVQGRSNVVLITSGLWQRRFGGADVIGRTMYTNGQAQTIVGVLPADFKLPLDYRVATPAQIFFPLVLPPFGGMVPQQGGSHGYYALGRLAAGETVRSANAEFKSLTDRMTAEGIYPNNWDFGAFVVSAPDEVAGPLEKALWVLLGAVGLVLLIACANVANLLLVRAEDRRREVSVRAALGASSGRLIRQFLTENLVLGLAGGALGLVFAFAGVRALLTLAPATLPRLPEVSIDTTVLAFTAGLSILTALLFGLLPALQGARVELQETLKEGGRANTAGATRSRLRQIMVVTQVALAVVLVIGAGLMMRSFQRLLNIDPGFDTRGVLTMRLSAPAAYYPDAPNVLGFYDRVLTEVRQLPGVRHAGMIRVLPIDTDIGDSGIMVEGYTNENGAPFGPADWQSASDGYFEAMGMELVAGRTFTASDRIDTEQVIMVNEAFVRKYFKGGEALDRRVRFAFRDSVPMQRIVGIVKDVKHNGLTGEVKATFYRPQQQWPVSTGSANRSMTLVVKTGGDPLTLAAPIRQAIRRADARLPVSNVKTLDDVMGGAVAQPRFTLALLLVFGGLALSLALVGIYGVVSYIVAQRRQEMGIRMALGAEPRAVVWLALRGGLVQTVAGVALGIAAAAAVTRVMTGLIFQTSPYDPVTYAAVAMLAVTATAIASWIPARRAALADPLSSLRSE